MPGPIRVALIVVALAANLALSACASFPLFGPHLSERECLMRAMYFESNRSSPDGLLAVGTVVMNRVGAPGYPKTICGVVGQPGQFAAGVLTQPMRESSVALVASVADRVLRGARHPALPYTTHFHTAGLTFPYNNMHYVLVAGGNAFYEVY
jgi:spore germination cell wall hydrolase CwlJ-like protein